MGHIYQIRNIENDKVYIGSSKNIKRREYRHWSELKDNCHANIYLQNAYNKYGKDSFRFEILYKCDNSKLRQEEQDELSRFIIGDNINHDFCYNILIDCASPSAKGRKHNDETKAKIGAANKGMKWSEELRKKHSELMRGKHLKHSQETKIKIGASNKGMKRSDESITNMITAQTKYIYRFVSPDGSIIQDESVKRLCRKYNLTNSAAYAVVSGKVKHTKGWRFLSKTKITEDGK